MATLEQVKKGVLYYIESDILPHLTGAKKFGFAAYVSLASENVVSIAEKYKSHPAVSVLNIVSDNGDVDIDKLYSAVTDIIKNGEKMKIDIPFIGELTIDRSDIEKLYRYIKGGIT